MTEVQKTLYIPLYGKQFVTGKGVILRDEKAVEIWQKEGFSLSRKASSKWLAYYMAMRARVFDDWVKEKCEENCVILHIGCGLDSRVLRVNCPNIPWYDVDFDEVIQVRQNYYENKENYTMLAGDFRKCDWLQQLPSDRRLIVLMEGVCMYSHADEVKQFLQALATHFSKVNILLDVYSEFAAKMSKYRNPIREVGVSTVYGVNDPKMLTSEQVNFVCEHDMTPARLVSELQGWGRWLFQKLYAGKMAKSLYHLYEYSIEK